MKTKLILVAAALAFAVPAKAQVLVDISQITCGEYLNNKELDRPLLSAWIGGFFMSTRNLTLIQSAYAHRNHEVITEYCREHKSAKLLESALKEFH